MIGGQSRKKTRRPREGSPGSVQLHSFGHALTRRGEDQVTVRKSVRHFGQLALRRNTDRVVGHARILDGLGWHVARRPEFADRLF